MTMEETKRRNEASMARKRANPKALNPAAASAGAADNALTPSSTGAMDSLLEKLRAAAPQARDQRDRRRRARLKDKHQVRIASGQTIPDLGDLTKKDGEDPDAGEDATLMPPAGGDEKMDPISEGEDVAERAASMLQGLRDNNNNNDPNSVDGRPSSRDGTSGSLRIRRRRESADDERRARRRRRGNRESTASTDDALERPGTAEEGKREEGIVEEDAEGDSTIVEEDHVPKTVVRPPTPDADAADGGRGRPIVVDD